MIRLVGKVQPEFRIADRTRSLASCTAISGRPTMVKEGSPGDMSTSTSTRAPSNPTMAQLFTLANMIVHLILAEVCPPDQLYGGINATIGMRLVNLPTLKGGVSKNFTSLST